jgi:putative two-component system response regulator
MARARILIADDQPDNLLILEDLLADRYEVHAVSDGSQVLDYVEGGGVADLVLLDVVMPGLDGFTVCRKLKERRTTSDIPVIFLTSLDSATDEEFGLSLGAEDFIHKPFSPAVVLARVGSHLKLAQATRLLKSRNEDLEKLVAARTQAIRRQAEELVRRKQEVITAQSATITAFCSLAEARDSETGNHILRTQHYVQALAEELRKDSRFALSLDEETLSLLFKSAPLHDIGKVAIPDAILLKPGKLTADEWEVMKRHCEYGRDAIASVESTIGSTELSFLRLAKEIAYSHHERWDGNGYPQGLAGAAIPMSARLMAIADVYDALISKRVYKEAIPHGEAVAMIAAERSSHFDPDVIDAWLRITDEFRRISETYQDGFPVRAAEATRRG